MRAVGSLGDVRMYWGQLVGMTVSIGLGLAVVVIGASVVRQHRRDVSGLVIAAGVAHMASSCLGPFVFAAVGALASRDGTEAIITMNQVASVVLTIVHALVYCLLLAALVQLARPPKLGPREGG